MDQPNHSLIELFEQLGLPTEESAMSSWLATHPLRAGTELVDADFWTETQREFLRQAFDADADWVEIVEKFGLLLQESDINGSSTPAPETELR